MKYTTPIAKSLNDKDFAGGIIFNQLVEAGTIVPFEGDPSKLDAQIFRLDKYCYTGTTFASSDTRAIITLEATFPNFYHDLRLFLSNGINRKTGKVEWLEVLPEPDSEYPIFGDDWKHKLSWFLRAEGIGINLYESLIRRCEKDQYLTAHYDLRGNVITTLEQRLKFFNEFLEYVDYITNQADRGRSRFGCMQRSRNYDQLLKKVRARVNGNLSPDSRYWGLMISSSYRFDTVTNYPSLIVNAADDAIVNNSPAMFQLLVNEMEKICKAQKVKLNPAPLNKPLTLESFRKIRDDFLSKNGEQYSSFLDLNFPIL